MTDANNLEKIIKNSKVLKDEDKKNFLEILPKLNEKQLLETEIFLEKADSDFVAIEKKYEEKKTEVYKKNLDSLKEAGHKAERMVRETVEMSSNKKDQQKEEELLKKLDQ
ncbi:hypothetical protein A2483_03570 [Candidatus Peregrinibacteria bacterium RIFOXYC2_FULL_33_13]|nr:MAG: hypothetical protein UR27_C0006G0020 [Candidatus Peregrinibacteria bacterium GW2011_GWA2_33_10]KKP39610.1 MAG: hypothetical protein UR30_C0009G0031 [Candidatus Peregrinibacteria bacterium GW2011_GWC2_33_13]OGJ50256.1 MAG: hypothetical protein A2229_00870 [Candidatus Peregrinibacteria bacterium RIFOXYA2_FULL_33_7]OGJ54615.1 MAG: hypothetical protein A2483_03570 [Candidatus Peregrinibacteria bacterium RIFOXYC2_FULL_33_13]